ncbi:hypothetical protein ABTX24_13455 [Nocardioides sp. NPDC127514]|uniref:hypothetical protein n=1 Tax=unclassified Nocardioides TaxID=2615069 RepID=UPI003316B664
MKGDLVEMKKVHLTREVFVAGGTPVATYNPRQGQRIEVMVRQYLSERGKALTIHGASKSGKTVLVERLAPAGSALWLHGQDINDVADFWTQLGTRLGIANSRTSGAERETSLDTKFGMAAHIGSLADGSWQRTDGERDKKSESATVPQHAADAVREHLASSHATIVVDDFHFIPDAAKRAIARAIKTLIANSPVILIAVPSEAFEVVRTEPNMEGRVWSLPIPAWNADELSAIGSEGFPLLNLVDPGGSVARKLAECSYGSPFLMQQLCHDLVRWELGVEETLGSPLALAPPVDFDRFLAGCADRMVPSIFPRLLAGPNPKGTERAPIRLKEGGISTDIYGTVLVAIRNLVPPMTLLERDVSTEVQRVTSTNVVRGRVTSALNQMNTIAFERRGDSDPVIRLRDQQLYIQDAILTFYLRHGSWSPAK